jgi:hypothetical protein
MLKHRFCYGVVSISCALAALAPAAHADFFLHGWEDHYQPLDSVFLDVEGLYYSTSQNFDPNGNKYLPTNLTSYKRTEGDGLLAFGVFNQLSLFGRLSFASVNLTSSGTYNGTSTGAGDQTLGATFRAFQKQLSTSDSRTKAAQIPISLDLQLQTDIPAYNNNNADTNMTPYLGDGTVDVTFGAFLKVPLTQSSSGNLFLLSGLGYEYRSSSYSAAVPWSILAQFERHTSGFIFNAGVLGYQSLKDDNRGISVSSTSSLNNLSPGTGGSFMSSAINPSLIRLRGSVGYQLEGGSAILVAVDQAVWGQDAPYGTLVSLGFQTHFGVSSSASVSKRTHEVPLTHQGFVNYSMDAHVVKSNDRLSLVKIDKGAGDGVEVGQLFDIYKPLSDGTAGEAIARCEVVSVKSDQAALNVLEYYKEVFIDEGFLAKRLIQN